jgi:hypothetical protein
MDLNRRMKHVSPVPMRFSTKAAIRAIKIRPAGDVSDDAFPPQKFDFHLEGK